MKVTKSSIHRLTVAANCGCAAWGEYTDPAFKLRLGDLEFKPCESHSSSPSPELYAPILKEVVEKEAQDSLAPEPEYLEHRGHRPVPRVHAPVEAVKDAVLRPLPVPAKTVTGLAADPGVRGPQPQRPSPLTSSTGGMTTTRTPLAQGTRHVDASPGGSKRSGIGRVDPGAGSRTAGLNKAAANPMAMDLGDSVAEDVRVTKLIEASGVLDTDAELSFSDDD